MRDLWKCFELVKDATSLEELDAAAVMLGKVLATLGFETLLAVVSYGVLKLAKPAANAVRKGTDAIGDMRKRRRAGDKADDAVPPTTGPGSASHKAARWASYQERGGKWSYDRWSKQYDVNMTQASKANKAMDAYRDKIGWGEREVSVKVKVNGKTVTRRLDIADKTPGVKKAIEHKTGYQSLTKANEYEIVRDAALQNKRGWSIEWIFEGKPSKPLLEALDKNGISYKIIGN